MVAVAVGELASRADGDASAVAARRTDEDSTDSSDNTANRDCLPQKSLDKAMHFPHSIILAAISYRMLPEFLPQNN